MTFAILQIVLIKISRLFLIIVTLYYQIAHIFNYFVKGGAVKKLCLGGGGII